MNELRAVLWDMDGTLVDTEPSWIAAEYALAERHGATWSRDLALELVGNNLIDSGRFIREHMRIDLSAEEIVEDLLDAVIADLERDIPWRPGARELLADLSDAGIPCGLVTMSYQRFAGPIVAHLPVGSFDVLVTGDVVDNGKPHPEPYLRAAELLGVRPEECLAIEDSNTGVASAEAAGCAVLCVPHHVAVPSAPTRTLAVTLDGLSVGDLRSFLRRDG